MAAATSTAGGGGAGLRFVVPFARHDGFVGREEELAQVHALLESGEVVGVRPAAAAGRGGVGKTQLAVEYAYRRRDDYPGGVYWVNAAGDVQVEMAALAMKVGLFEDGARDTQRQRQRVLALVSFLDERPDALVIFDDVADPGSLQREAFGFVPALLACRVLFTTRVRDAAFATVAVGGLPAGEGLRLLERGARRALEGSEREAARDVCRTLGDLPLALALAAAFLGRNHEVTLAGYGARIARHGALSATDTNTVTSDDLATRHTAAVEATLASQWEALEGEEARLTLRAAALLDEGAMIPRARLALLTGLAAVAEEGLEAPLDEALQELVGLSLVEDFEEQEAVRLHPLVREFAARRIEGEGRADFAAGCARNLGEALWEVGRLNDEAAARGVGAVLEDLRLGARLSREGEARWIERLARPLDREAHCLRKWKPAERPELLLQQVRNRCFEMLEDDILGLAEDALAERSLRPLRERLRSGRESEALVRTLEGHTEDVCSVAVTADGRWVVSGCGGGTLEVWDLGRGQLVRTLRGHTKLVNSVAVTADGRWAVSASDDSTLRVWDLGSGQLVRVLEGHRSSVTSVAVTADGRWAASASVDRTLKVWDLGSGQLVRTLEGHANWATGVAVTADGRRAVTASADKTLKVWDLDSGQLVRTLEGHTSWALGVAVTADGRWAVSASVDRTLKVWDLGSGQLVRTLEGHSHEVTSVAVTADGRWAVSASLDTTLKVWDLGSGQLVRTLEGHTRGVTSVAVTADGRWAVSASWEGTKVWDLGSRPLVRALEGHRNSVTGVAVTADGRRAVSASWDGTLRVWDLGSGQLVRTLERTSLLTDVAVTVDGRWAVSACRDGPLKVWDLGSGQLVRTLEGHTNNVSGVAVTADGRWVVSVSWDRTLKVWDLGSGQLVRTLEDPTKQMLFGVAVTADGRRAISASNDGTLKVWDLGSGQLVHTLEGHSNRVNRVAVTADGRWAVSASKDSTLKVWDLGSGQLVRTLEGHSHEVTSVAVTADGRWAVSASEDKTLRVWDLTSGLVAAMLESPALLYSCAVASDRLLLAGDAAGALHILDWLPVRAPVRAVDAP